MHLLIPFASQDAPACVTAVQTLQLPHLEKLLRQLVLTDTDSTDATSLSPPHERALAKASGLSARDGCIAWAAQEAAMSGLEPAETAWAWISPVHWDVGADRITMADPATLGLDGLESRALFDAMAPFFAGDGITLHHTSAQRWLARGDIFDNVASASLDRVAARDISAWMPGAPVIRRLQNEMQMLLYTHPVNDARAARGLTTVNSFWVSGTGRYNSGAGSPDPDVPVVADGLRDAALREDWAAWALGWATIDETACGDLLAALNTGGIHRLTLCGERAALTFSPARDGAMARLRRRFTRITLQDLREQL